MVVLGGGRFLMSEVPLYKARWGNASTRQDLHVKFGDFVEEE